MLRKLTTLAMLFAVWLCGCDRHSAEDESARVLTDEVRECYRRSNEASLSLLQTLGQEELDTMLAGKSSAELVISIRRERERICMEEAACLGIPEAQRGLYLKDCLRRMEDNE
jgi:hypothetical protein